MDVSRSLGHWTKLYVASPDCGQDFTKVHLSTSGYERFDYGWMTASKKDDLPVHNPRNLVLMETQ